MSKARRKSIKPEIKYSPSFKAEYTVSENSIIACSVVKPLLNPNCSGVIISEQERNLDNLIQNISQKFVLKYVELK